MKNILVIGGAGYVGSVLIPKLLFLNYRVTVYDLMIYGNTLPTNNQNLKIVKNDIRNIKELEKVLINQDAIIHLACVSNDPSFELNPKLGKEINYDCFEPLVNLSKKNKIKHFIYASSSSVYGVKPNLNVDEKCYLEPLTDYSKFKAECENILIKYSSSEFITTILRPATVCGYSKRQRLDLVVNILTNLGYHTKEIKIFGGNQLRPNIHIDDMADAYIHILKSEKSKVANQIFNVGFENHSVEDLAKIVKKKINKKIDLVYCPSEDNRSYHINSNKIKKILGFQPKKNIADAIQDLVDAFEKKLLLDPLNNIEYSNIKKMQSINLI